MKKIIIFLLSLFFLFPIFSTADEGMWLLPKVKEFNIDTMRKYGLNLSAEEIYSVSNPSLKDAVVVFGGGCTGEVVSSEGLVFTNHHCGFEAIQSISSVDRDYLKDGFWATDKKTEIPCKDLTVSFLVRFDDVTDSIIPFLPDTLSEKNRKEVIDSIKIKLCKVASDSGRYETEVKDFYGGTQYYLIVTKVYKDIRLVGTPPSSIGKFGGNTDNWMWPRQTGDFSMFRIYSDSVGNPVNYSPSNIPYKPLKFLPVSLKGVEDGDFSMIIGYPGITQRFMTTSEIKEIFEVVNPTRIKIRGARLDTMLKDMKANPKINIQYASKYARSVNYWKYSIGENKGITRLHVIERKKELENKYSTWVQQDSVRSLKFDSGISIIDKAIEFQKPYLYAIQYYNEAFFRGIELYTIGRQLIPLYEQMQKSGYDTIKIKHLTNSLQVFSSRFFKDYNLTTDKKIAGGMFQLFSSDIDKDYKFDLFLELEKKYIANYRKFVQKIYNKSFLTDSIKLKEFLMNPSLKKLSSDPAFLFVYNSILKYREIYKVYSSNRISLMKGERLYISGLLEMERNNHRYPDANFSMRLTYGKIKGYKPMDAVHYDYYTTLSGIIEKEDSNNTDFIVPDKIKQLYKKKDFGKYSKNSDIPVCFLTDNDITGGNSGSPVMNADGQLTGIAFDSNWEGMSGNLIYEPDLQRAICVDIRYILFIIDKYAGAGYLLNEMKIEN